nr:hypothetical protein [uncultured Campylobacter sp.]
MSGRVKIRAEAVGRGRISRSGNAAKQNSINPQSGRYPGQKWHRLSQASCVSSGRAKDKIFHEDGKVQQYAARVT